MKAFDWTCTEQLVAVARWWFGEINVFLKLVKLIYHFNWIIFENQVGEV